VGTENHHRAPVKRVLLAKCGPPHPGRDHADELLNVDTHLRHGWMSLFIGIIGPYGLSMVSFVTLSAAKGLSAPLDCHAERSEASVCPSRQMLRFAQHDRALPSC
jgi:hypothetical protein